MKTLIVTKKQGIKTLLFVLFLLCGILAFPQQVLYSGKQTVELILSSVVPSLFPFFICTDLLVRSGYVDEISKSLRLLMRPLFRLSGACSLCLVLGLLCGYPVGARTAGMLYRSGQITKEEAERTLGFCNNAGPLFILGTIASGFFADGRIGILLLSSHMLSALTVGLLLRFKGKKESESFHEPVRRPSETKPVQLADAVTGAVKLLAQIGGYILLFSALIEIMDQLFSLCSLPFLSNITAPVLELTNGIHRVSLTTIPLQTKIILSSLILGFGGICVYYQVKTIANDAGISARLYLPCKLLQGIISAGYTALFLTFFPLTQGAFSPVPIYTPPADMNFGKMMIVSIGYTLLAVFLLSLVSFLINLYVQRKQNKGRD